MKSGFYLKIGAVAFIAVFLSACFGLTDDNEPVHKTAEAEQILIEAYLDGLVTQGYDIDTTDLGIYYVTITDGEGVFPMPGDTLEVGYNGYFLDGKLFDSSDLYEEDGIWQFVLGNPPMIQGWENGMSVINKGATVQVIIPSEYAYGVEGSGIIAPYETLIFVIEMFDIRPS